MHFRSEHIKRNQTTHKGHCVIEVCSKSVLRSFAKKVRARCDPSSLCICKGVRISSENVSENIACTGALFELTLLTNRPCLSVCA